MLPKPTLLPHTLRHSKVRLHLLPLQLLRPRLLAPHLLLVLPLLSLSFGLGAALLGLCYAARIVFVLEAGGLGALLVREVS